MVSRQINGNKKRGKLAIILFFGIFAIAGTAAFYFLGVKTLIKLNNAESWLNTPCIVLSSKVKSQTSSSSKGGSSTTYSIYIRYKYNYNGQKITNNQYSFNTGSSSGYDGKAEVVRLYPKGKKTTCYVNPQNPTEAVISREGGTRIVIGVIIGLLFGGVGYLGIFYTLFGKDKRRKAKQKKVDSYQRNDDKIDKTQWEVTGNQNVELKPKSSRLGKLIGVLFMCIFWNGITWTIMLPTIKDGFSFILLFMSLFVIIGLVLVGAVIHQLLALGNAKARITISSNAIRIGECATVSWVIPNKVKRISDFTLSFVGVESATYRRGTNTHTDTYEFHRELLLQTTDHNEMSSGEVIIALAATTMHTFSSTNNKITWLLKIHGDIKSWPDIKDEYEIEILPMRRK